MLEIDTIINNFTLKDQYGNDFNLYDIKNKKIIIYFYPKDSTPGCTKEACVFKSTFEEMKNLNAIIIGISKDSIKSHANFASKNELPFILLSDENLEVIKYFGAYGEKKNYGKTYYGIIRSTFVLNNEYKLIKKYPKANPATNALEILEYLKKEEE